MKTSFYFLAALFFGLCLVVASCKKEDTPVTPVVTPPGSGTTITTAKSTAKIITGFAFNALSPAVTGTIDATAKTISATVATGTDVTKLVPTITVSDKATVSPASGATQDFSKAVTYTVTAEDTSTQIWKVNVTVTAPLADVLYFGANSGDNNIYAVDLATGIKKWSYTVGTAKSGIYSSPLIADGIVYAGSRSPDNKLYALDATTGKSIWVSSTYDSEFESSPFVSNGVIYIATYLDGKLYALDAKTGKEKWNFKGGYAFQSSPTVVDGILFIANYDNKLYALDAVSGQLKWSFTTGDNLLYSTPLVEKGIVYFGGGGKDKNIYAVDAKTGSQKWAFLAKDSFTSSPTTANGLIYIGDYSGNFYSIDATTGVMKWTFKGGGQIGSSPTVANGTVYFGCNDKNFYALDASTGTKKWSYTSNNSYMQSSPVVVNNVVYIGADLKTLNAFDATTGAKVWNFATLDNVYSSPCVVYKGQVYRGLGNIHP